MHLLTQIRRKFITSFPVKFVIRKSKNIILPGFSGIPLFDVIRFFFIQIQKTSLNERAASIAFNLLVAIPPACIFLFTLIPYLPIKDQLEQLYELIREVIPGKQNNEPIISFLRDFASNEQGGLLSFGFLLALYFSSNAMIGIMRSFNKMNYLGFSQRHAVHDRWVAIKLTLILFLIILMSIVVLVSRGTVLTWLGIEDPFIRTVIFNVRWVVIVLLFFLTISFIYKYAPAVHKKWKLINPGSILATFMMIVYTMGFSYYVANFGNYNKLYGSIGTILILMLLIFFNSLVLLIGFELNVSISSLRKLADQRKNPVSGG
ncbi:MAG TPA: YihY/virulence factor BrkB family protein [Chitinophagaceae bacterium]|jgi:membrane protein|nr:YihY/virulence factor BrkB family protein [Chitinophagaceae bacterium]